jgi:hypothetical protein
MKTRRPAKARLRTTSPAPTIQPSVFSRSKDNNSHRNTAIGDQALAVNDTGDDNTALGFRALFSNLDGSSNIAIGRGALFANIGGFSSTAIGWGALTQSQGDDNTALGAGAGPSVTTGSGNVFIGAGMTGVAGNETDHTYIRNINTTSVSGFGTDAVTVNLATGLLGHATSSRRYKEDIQSMNKASETLYHLKPVTFRYKKEIDQTQSLEYGLVAEDVAEVDPNLAVRDGKGQIETVRYTAVNAMLLNEFLKEHKTVQQLESKAAKQDATIAELRSTVAKQEATIAAATERDGGFHGTAQGAGRANPESERSG